MGDLVEILWPSHHKRLCEGISRLFNAKEDCDFEISFSDDPSPIRAHWLILQIFSKALTNSDSKQIRFEDDSEVSKDDIGCLMELIYRGKAYVDRQKLDRVRKAGKKMGMHVFFGVINHWAKTSNEDVDEEINAFKISRTEEEHNYYGMKRKVESEKDENKVIDLSCDENNFITKDDEEEKKRMKRKVEIENDENKVIDLSCDENNFITKDDEEESKSNVENFEIIEEHIPQRSEEILLDDQMNALSQTEIDYICPICDKTFVDKYKFSSHVKSHSKPSVNLQCPHCPFRTRRLPRHLASRHQMDSKGNLLEKSFKCDECDYACVANFLLKNHKTLRHKERLKCDECSVTFLSKSAKVQHKKEVHTDERPFMCDSCGACFKTAKSLRAHQETHLGIKWVCDICGTKVSQASVWAHKKLHVEGGMRKKIKCPLCNRPFRQKSRLKVHIKGRHKVTEEEIEAMINSGAINIPEDEIENAVNEISSFGEKKKGRKVSSVKPICSVCDLTLSSKSALYRHMKQHKDKTLVKRFQCPLCEYSTIEKFILKKHLKGKHKLESEQVNEIAKKVSGEFSTVESESEDPNDESEDSNEESEDSNDESEDSNDEESP